MRIFIFQYFIQTTPALLWKRREKRRHTCGITAGNKPQNNINVRIRLCQILILIKSKIKTEKNLAMSHNEEKNRKRMGQDT